MTCSAKETDIDDHAACKSKHALLDDLKRVATMHVFYKSKKRAAYNQNQEEKKYKAES